MPLVEAGKRYYAMVHAYHHFVFEVVHVLGQKHVEATKIVRVQSSQRDWTTFFKDGFGEGDAFKFFPDGEVSGWFAIFEWHHDIPKPPEGFPSGTKRQQ